MNVRVRVRISGIVRVSVRASVSVRVSVSVFRVLFYVDFEFA